MQETPIASNRIERDAPAGRRRWLSRAVWLTVSGAAALTAWAQAPSDAPAAPAVAPAEATAVSDAASEPEAPWNRRRAAPRGVDGQLQRLTTDLKLDVGQQNKIRPILAAHQEQVQRLMADTQLPAAERRKRLRALGDRNAEQIRAQLTDVQRTQYIQPRAPAPAAPAASTASTAKRSAPPSTAKTPKK